MIRSLSQRRLTAGLLFLSLFGHTGCALLSDGRGLMKTIWVVQPSPENVQRPLVVFLPGRFDDGRDFSKHDFPAQLAGRADAVLVDANLSYYRKGTFSERLTADVIGPARARGYKDIWVVGVSLGGIGALLYEAEHPGTWSGVVLLAPYVGDEKGPFAAIDAAGGLDAWNPAPPAPDDFQSRLWVWIKAQDFKEFPVYLGAGESDRMAAYHVRLAARLPADRVVMVKGAHDWTTWTALWRQIAPTLPLGEAKR